jgi:hypothetical protein
LIIQFVTEGELAISEVIRVLATEIVRAQEVTGKTPIPDGTKGEDEVSNERYSFERTSFVFRGVLSGVSENTTKSIIPGAQGVTSLQQSFCVRTSTLLQNLYGTRKSLCPYLLCLKPCIIRLMKLLPLFSGVA